MKKILVTGCSGFIGAALSKNLLEDDYSVIGLDNMDPYYSKRLKQARLDILNSYKNFDFLRGDISDINFLDDIFKRFKPYKVINLAAQAGVRYSLQNPHIYIRTNVVGFMNILECCKNYKTRGLIYASSSSVYGQNEKTPFSIKDRVETPISIYAVSKISNELMAKTYSHLYDLNTTGLRFFSVYGPWGRPDMAMFIFSKNIIMGKKISVFNNGNMFRDFTYIDDIVTGIKLSMVKNYPCEIFNLGNNKSENLMEIISILETCLGKKAKINFEGMQPGDVKNTYADIDYTTQRIGYDPKVSIQKGIPKFIEWYKAYSAKK